MDGRIIMGKSALTSLDAYQLMHESIIALAHAEKTGIRVDVDKIKSHEDTLTNSIMSLEKELRTTDLFAKWNKRFGSILNLDSSDQLATMLYSVLKLKAPKMTDGGKGSTDDESLKSLKMPELDKILQIRKLKKIRDTYLASYKREQVGGVLHPSFQLHNVITFRSSCEDPNFQNVPKREKKAKEICRSIIVPRKGFLLAEVDFAKIEVSISACYHKDPVMLKYLLSNSSDMHADTMIQLFLFKKYLPAKLPGHGVLRNGTKNGFVFPQFYGDYYANCAINLSKWAGMPVKGKWKKSQGIEIQEGHTIGEHLFEQGISTFDDFKEHVRQVERDFWNKRFKVYSQWKKEWFESYQSKGYFDTLTGFRCQGIMSRNEVINYPVQGSAFHCLLWSFVKIHKIMIARKWKTRLIGQIHDAIIMDVHPDEVDEVMTTVKRITCYELRQAWKWIIVPLDISAEVGEVDGDWLNQKHYDLPKLQ